MPGQAAGRTSDRIEYSRQFQLLSCDILLQAECARLGSHLDYIVQNATTDWPIKRSIEIDIRDTTPEGGHRVFYDGQLQFEHHDPAAIVFQIFADLYRAAEHGLEDQVNLHAASLVYRDQRVLVTGASGAGKTTLAMAALSRAEWRVEGDNRVFLRDRLVMAWPRRLHIKDEGLKSFPELELELRKMPRIMGDGRLIYAFDPSEFGHEWRIGRGPAAAIIHLERPARPYSGPTGLEISAKVDMVRLLTRHAIPSALGRQDCLRQLSELADSAACYRLISRDLTDSLVAVESVLQ